MTDFAPEIRNSELPFIKQLFKGWDQILKDKGLPLESDIEDSPANYGFLFDRRNDPESLLTADDISVTGLKEPLEQYANLTADFKSLFGESWIIINIYPKDPYYPKFGVYKERDNKFYYVEGLEVYLSSQGRAYQTTDWREVLEPDAHGKQQPRFQYLKKLPSDDDTQKFDQEPDHEHLEPLDVISGSVFERVDYLLSQVETGNVIER